MSPRNDFSFHLSFHLGLDSLLSLRRQQNRALPHFEESLVESRYSSKAFRTPLNPLVRQLQPFEKKATTAITFSSLPANIQCQHIAQNCENNGQPLSYIEVVE